MAVEKLGFVDVVVTVFTVKSLIHPQKSQPRQQQRTQLLTWAGMPG
jgi:hypothetical protein